MEVGTRKQAKGLLGHCLPLLDRYEKNRKVLLSPSFRWYRRKCCDSEEHCTNFCAAGYNKGMLADLMEVKDAMMELCREQGMQMYIVMSTCELLGLRAAMEEDKVERILGKDLVHMTEDGFVTLAENIVRTLDNPPHCLWGKRGAGTSRRRGWWSVVGRGRPRSGCTTRCLGRGQGGIIELCSRGRRWWSAACPGAAEPEGTAMEDTWDPEVVRGLLTTRVRKVPFVMMDPT